MTCSTGLVRVDVVETTVDTDSLDNIHWVRFEEDLVVVVTLRRSLHLGTTCIKVIDVLEETHDTHSNLLPVMELADSHLFSCIASGALKNPNDSVLMIQQLRTIVCKLHLW